MLPSYESTKGGEATSTQVCSLLPVFSYAEHVCAHMLFAVENIQKILNMVEPREREATTKLMLFQGCA